MRLRSFILMASALVAAIIFVGGYFVASRIIENTVRENARDASDVLAQVTFTSMYQVMSTGWKRRQAEAFVAAVRDSARGTPTTLQIYRSPVVEKDYGIIEQPPLDAALRRALADGQPVTETPAGGIRYIMPLIASERCERCHENARIGDVLGAIEVRQDFTPLIERARTSLLTWLAALAPILLCIGGFVVWRVNRRIEQSLDVVSSAVARVNAVSDLQKLEFERQDLGFVEFNQLFAHLGELTTKLRAIAVDKGVLLFEIGVMEKFVITSDVVRDWGDYIGRLLVEINQVMTTHVLFSVFEVDDELFDIEIFWRSAPDATTRQMLEEHVRQEIFAEERFSELSKINITHHIPSGATEPLVLDAETISLYTKALIVDKPKIGGIVGIGVNANTAENDTLRLVMESILSTMLNVVGSVKAIHKYTQDMEYYATRDPLTDLFNRRVFWELFDYEVARARRHGYQFALLVMDLDNFKLVNDGYGHAFGDRWLQHFAHTVRQALRPGDIFARYGGDEFVLLLPDTPLTAAVGVAERLIDAIGAMSMASPDGKIVTGGASIGMAVFPLHAEESRDLFLFADNMLYKAKAAGKHQVGIPSQEEVAEVFRDITQTTVQVVNAVNEGRIEPFFQPILDLQGGRVAGFEVLSRLTIEGVDIEASRFIELAEKAGVIHRLDLMVMEKALLKAAQANFGGYLFINLSPRALALADFLTKLKDVVGRCGIPPGRIVFEITERDTVKNIVVLEQLVGELKLAGFKLAIDDFGSGFSSFQYLRRFPVDFLKIEGDFVINFLESEKDRAFINTIYKLASDLGIKVIAEHVENLEVLEELRRIGIGYGQGYHIGKPARGLGGGQWPLA
jgi:diguanylate cyclase (GGDEF)-like protein